jgi:hypothetical protein
MLLGNSATAQTNVDWLNNETGDWNDFSNWAGGFIPSREFDEVAVIANGGTAFLNSPVVDQGADTAAAGISISNGTLEIRSGGLLEVRPGATAGNGAIAIGGAGVGQLTVLGGGGLSAESLSMAGPAATSLNLSGNAVLDIIGSASLVRTTRIAGPDVTFNVGGDLTIGQSFIAEVTSPSLHSAIAVAGDLVIQNGATLQLDLGGGTPAFGDSWTLVSGASSVNGRFAAIDGPALNSGLGYRQSTAGGNLTVSVGSVLTLSIDRTTGAAAISNSVGTVDLALYAIGSSGGHLTPSTWDSFADTGFDDGGWLQGAPNGGNANGLAEARLAGFSTFSAGQSQSIGEVLNTVPLPFGQERDDVTFDYLEPGSREFSSGVVEYTGARNNLVLVVDPSTGQAVLQNQSTYDVDMRLYSITSSAGSLMHDPLAAVGSGWDSLAETGADGGAWLRGAGSSSVLAEARASGALRVNSGDIIALGSPFGIGGVQDLEFQFLLEGETSARLGVVEYGAIPITGSTSGDFNGDGIVDAADYTVWRDNLGAPDESAFINGSGNGGGIDSSDYTLWRANFGNQLSGSLVASSVPEPTGMVVVVGITIFGCCVARARNKRPA